MRLRGHLAALIVLSFSLALAACSRQGQRSERPEESAIPVILLSIDGLKPDYVLEADRHRLKIPNLRRLVSEGTFASGVTGVAPTLTYPSHTTLITGVSPARHGILMNSTFDPLGKNQGGWYWYSEDIHAPTLWEAASRAGLVTASIDWPVSVGAEVHYNIVQYWRGSMTDDHKLARALSTRGLLDEAEKDCGPYPTGYAYLLPDDTRRAKFIAWMIEKKRPHLLTAYFSSLDEEQHLTAPYSQVTFETLEGVDTLVGEVRAAAERAYQGRFVLAVVSDHGHVTAAKELHLNAALSAAGLIELDEQQKVKSWRALAWTSGGSAAVMLREAGDEEARGRVRELLGRLAASPDSGIERVLEGEEARALGGFSGAAFVVALRPGFKAGSGLSGETMRMGKAGGTHGYLPGPRDMESAFFIVGPGIAAARDLGKIDMRDIAPTMAGILKVSLPSSEGRDLLAHPNR